MPTIKEIPCLPEAEVDRRKDYLRVKVKPYSMPTDSPRGVTWDSGKKDEDKNPILSLVNVPHTKNAEMWFAFYLKDLGKPGIKVLQADKYLMCEVKKAVKVKRQTTPKTVKREPEPEKEATTEAE